MSLLNKGGRLGCTVQCTALSLLLGGVVIPIHDKLQPPVHGIHQDLHVLVHVHYCNTKKIGEHLISLNICLCTYK